MTCRCGRKISTAAAVECDRLSWRFMCAVCLCENLRQRNWRRRPWAEIVERPAIKMEFV
jgi:hypothetical protein